MRTCKIHDPDVLLKLEPIESPKKTWTDKTGENENEKGEQRRSKRREIGVC